MKKRKLVAALSGIMAFSVALTGCGGNTNDAAKQGETKTAETKKEDKKGGKTLIVGRGGDSVGLDPITITDGESARVTENIMETLVKYKKENTEVIPGLAEKWDITPDGKEYTFHLRKGVTFHDGTPFNAEAVKFNFERWMDKNNPYHDKEGYEYYNDMFGGYKGDKDHVIASVDVKDEYTVVLTLNRPLAPLMQNLGMFPFAIASPDAVKKGTKEFNEKPVGTGPFKFEKWNRNDSITISKNTDYWQKGLPKLDKVIFKVIPDNSARLTALTSGEIDIMDGLNPDDAKSVKENKDLQLFVRPSMNAGWLGFNIEKKPLDNVKVRQAMGHAVDKQGMIEAFYSGFAQPATNPLPPSIWSHNDQIKDREYNLEKAKQLLTEAGYPNGFKVKFWAMPVPRPYIINGQKMAEAIQQDFKKIGIDAEIVSMDWATYLDKTKKGEQELYLLGWTGDNGDPDNFLNNHFNKNNIGGSNRSFYKDEKVTDLLVKAQSEVDVAKRTEIYNEIQQIIFDQAILIPLVHSTPPIAAKATVKGYVPHPKGNESLEEVDIE
ncbi:ABC transporter substrate-binding protein [Brevibacillus laterosporus]|uniref:ABC transporter substrate-binding protein n=1 Tax=Brevibacillus laterosporus TaxID=1465 RepID=UPI000CE2EC2C|nr:ABC transporter substrate-binding protein [Brevibacillus laterosporus]PPA85661.1 ABC transporter substrate-binding protein [Brevibacillus laterosporus]